MRITIRQKNLEITPALATYVESKVVKPVRRLLKWVSEKELPILDLELGRSTRHHQKGKVYQARASLALDGKLLRAEVDDVDIRTALDLLQEELEREILSYKNRLTALARRGSRQAKRLLRFAPAARFREPKRVREEGA